MKFILLGDVHGDLSKLKHLLTTTDLPILQMGDLGFADTYRKILRTTSPERLRVLGGNHDAYPVLTQYRHYLGDFGPIGDHSWFMRGALSIDKHTRIPGRSWWPEEELTEQQLDAAMQSYHKHLPRTVLSHDAPTQATQGWYMQQHPSRTTNCLRQMFKLHQPEQWFFGHHHRAEQREVGRTAFRCLAEHEALEVDL